MKNVILYSILLIGIIIINISPLPLECAVSPTVTYVASYSEAGIGPARIAVDTAGRLYVANSSDQYVAILSNSGKRLSTIRGFGIPLGIATDKSGKIYVGDSRARNVKVFDLNGKFLYKLGSGDGEVGLPNAIAISSTTGNIYVIDSEVDKVKVYNPDGSFAFSFGGEGSDLGKFSGIYGMAIDDTAGEVIVSDWNCLGNYAARIQIFNLNGTYKASFTTYNQNYFRKLGGVDVDKAGRIYVTDTYQSLVQVFDRSSGISLGFVENDPNQTYLPTAVAIDPDNKIFITSPNKSKIIVYGLDTFNALNLEPETMVFTGEEGGPNPPSQSLSITNKGDGVLQWTATTDSPWLTINPSSGTAPTQVEVSVNISSLGVGTYKGAITITTTTGVIGAVAVELTVKSTPAILDVSPLSLNFIAQYNGRIPSPQKIYITNIGGGSRMEWSASADQTWMSLSSGSGNGNSTVSVTVDTASLGIGTYRGKITVTSPRAQGSPKLIDVTLNLISAGDIYVTTNLSSATFTITGPATYSGKGTSYYIENAPSGAYTIKYGGVAGYKKPYPEKKTLISGSTITFTGIYTDFMTLANRRAIITAQGPGPQNTALIKLWKRDGTYISEFGASDLLYSVNIASGDIDGDGIDDIIVGAGPDPKNPALLRVFKVFKKDGSLITELYPFAYKYGVNVASGDIDGDGIAEIIVGAGPDPKNPAHVRVFTAGSQAGNLIDTGIDFYAYSYTYGVKIAGGDIDGDGLAEIITAPGPGPQNPSLIKIWKVDTSEGIGKWKVTEEAGSLTVYESKYGANISTGDIDGDGLDEIIAGAGPSPNSQSSVKVIKADGTVFSEFTADNKSRYGVNVASADLDGDGIAEIITGSGAGPKNTATVRVFNANGVPTGMVINAYSTMYGVNVSVGVMLIEENP